MIKAIIFDFDGTISNRQMNAYTIFNDYFRKFFKDLDDLEYEAVLQDLLTDDCNGTINVRFRLAPFISKYKNYLPEGFEEEFIDFYYEYMWKYAVLKDETRDVLEKLKGKYKLAILSNGQSKSQHDKIDHVEVDEYFDEILVSGDIGINKPDKRIFEHMADKLEVKCEECLFVGDVFSSDIVGAIRAKMIPVWVVTDQERPSLYYQGYRIEKLDKLFSILDKENEVVTN